MLRTFALEIKVALKPFSKILSMTKCDLNSFERFASLSQRMVSILSLKNLPKN